VKNRKDVKGKLMKIKNINEELLKAAVDKGSSIKLAKLTGDEKISIYIAEISPKSILNPHCHKSGIETYQIYKGSGIMKVGDFNEQSVEWIETIQVKEGDCFTIDESKVHQLINDTDFPLLAIFSCPSAHLATDRFFIN
jgi:mannose-6-phosphate isomerase-like protein (cupin superfamily)